MECKYRLSIIPVEEIRAVRNIILSILNPWSCKTRPSPDKAAACLKSADFKVRDDTYDLIEQFDDNCVSRALHFLSSIRCK